MKTPPYVLAIVGALGVAVVAGPALGQGPKEKHEERKEKREERREDRKDAREERKDDAKDAADDRKEKRDGLKEEWKKKHEEWVAKRKERREERRAELTKEYGEDLLKRPAARAELRVHARRIARLERIKFLADANAKADLSAKATSLIEKENARHAKRMATLKAAPAAAEEGK